MKSFCLSFIFFFSFISIFLPPGTCAQAWNDVFQEGWALHQSGHYADAAPLLEKSLQLLKSTPGASGEDIGTLTYLLAFNYEQMQETGKALRLYHEAKERLYPLRRRSEDLRNIYLNICNNRAMLLINQEPATTVALWQEAIDLLSETNPEHPQVADWLHAQGIIYHNILEEIAQARQCWQKAARIYGNYLPGHIDAYAELLLLLAQSYTQTADISQAKSYYEQLHREARKHMGQLMEYNAYLQEIYVFYRDYLSDYPAAHETVAEGLRLIQNLQDNTAPAYAEWLTRRGVLYYFEGKHKEAEADLSRSMNMLARADQALYAYSEAMEMLAMVYDEQGRFQEAEQLYLKSLDAVARSRGEDSYAYAVSLGNTGKHYLQRYRLVQAGQYLNRAAQLFAGLVPLSDSRYRTVQSNRAIWHTWKGNYPMAISLMEEVIAHTDSSQVEYAFALNRLAEAEHAQGNYRKALEHSHEAIRRMQAHGLSKWHAEYFSARLIMAACLNSLGTPREAEQIYLDLLKQIAQSAGTQNRSYWMLLNSMGQLYFNEGQWTEAERYFLLAIQTAEAVFGKRSLAYAQSVNNMGLLYRARGNRLAAAAHLKQALSIYQELTGMQHPEYITILNNLGLIYSDASMLDNALLVYTQALSLAEENLGKKHALTTVVAGNLALIYMRKGRYDAAEEIYQKYNFDTQEDPTRLSKYYNNLAMLYAKKPSLDSALVFVRRAARLVAEHTGIYTQDYVLYRNNEGYFLFLQRQYEAAFRAWAEAGNIQQQITGRSFAGLSQKEKEYYVQAPKQQVELTYSLLLHQPQAEVVAWLFEQNTFWKSLLFFSNTRLRTLVQQSNDPQLRQAFEHYLAMTRALNETYQMNARQRKEKGIELRALEQQAEQAEKNLSLLARRAGLQKDLVPKAVEWQQVRAQLKAGEAYIDLVRFAYGLNEDSVYYAAFIITSDTRQMPRLVLLPAREVEERYLPYYRNSIRLKQTDRRSYRGMMAPFIETLPPDIHTIYFSADGVYHLVNPATFYLPGEKRFLGEKYRLYPVGSAQNFIKKEAPSSFRGEGGHLFGYPEYQAPVRQAGKVPVPTPEEDSLWRSQRFFDTQNMTVTPLPGTLEEIKYIYNLFEEQGLTSYRYTGKLASEQQIKQIKQPFILHIATHGFFLPAKQPSNLFDFMSRGEGSGQRAGLHPLYRTGLLLSGAQNTLRKEALPQGDNGILFAAEVQELPLLGCQLVVLSACETGLGELQNGEGVYGLQRAFMEAGAEAVIMSLWRVDDQATQKLMQLFYSFYIREKESKAEAFRHAIRLLKEEYPAPYYWGAFVLIEN